MHTYGCCGQKQFQETRYLPAAVPGLKSLLDFGHFQKCILQFGTSVARGWVGGWEEEEEEKGSV